MRTRSYDPSLDAAILLGVGSAHAVADPDGEPEPVGKIWLPFEGSRGALRGGWRARYVASPSAPTSRQPIGFRPR